MPNPGGTQHRTKLTEADVQRIRTLAKIGMTYTMIALRYRISANTVSSIVRRLTYQDVK